MAICAVTDSTGGPSRPSESIIGRASAADDDAISTAYSAAWPVPKRGREGDAEDCRERRRRRRRAAAPSESPTRNVESRTGTWVPTTNITSAKPMLASSVNVGSDASTMSESGSAEDDPGDQFTDDHRDAEAGQRGQQRAGRADDDEQRQGVESEPGHLSASS